MDVPNDANGSMLVRLAPLYGFWLASHLGYLWVVPS